MGEAVVMTVGSDVRLDSLGGPPFTGGACSAVTLPTVDMAKLTAGWSFVLDGIRKAFDGVGQAARVVAEALQREQRRMRRRAARRGTQGRRGARSVAPWGVPWAMYSREPMTEAEAADVERAVMRDLEANDG